jgi:hypothetical protein
MDEPRERRILTRGFARAIGWGLLVLLVPTFAAAALLWRSYGDGPRTEFVLAAVVVVAAAAGGAYATSRIPRHPVAGEAMRNGAIAGLGVVGTAYLVTFLLAYSARNGWDRHSPVGFVAFGSFFLGWLLPMGLAAAAAGAWTGRVRGRRGPAVDVESP